MEDHDLIVEFDKYCETCQHKDLAETEQPCNECLEHPVNHNSHKPYCYTPRS